ncbi:hypothetical protein Z042_23920 [Chania multitudinisentens RB-25]|uniref:DUF4260 domain-containing protein n=1 Tax=Chania multitudinisentens RB-25 TaxID=1441930 RepID=W0LIY0_9GAMM|nr:DUF4260 domain-containing protein [Chania multitudinisentens]AHG22307.1 hypothetical protein Z042_23920 [Chania multitudinisentens RB-25]
MSGLTRLMRITLQLESLLVLILCVVIYHIKHYSWGTFAICFLLPDISLLGYAFGRQAGALSYNIAHSYSGPALLIMLFALSQQQLWLLVALIWCAHISFDRLLGYGLKYTEGFSFTHLGRLNSKRR